MRLDWHGVAVRARAATRSTAATPPPWAAVFRGWRSTMRFLG